MDDSIKDQIINGLKAGMTLADMYILCELDARDISNLEADPIFMSQTHAAPKLLEIDLLRSIRSAIDIQEEEGKIAGATWLLERINPRWAGKTDGVKAGVVNINFGSVDIDNEPTVAINHSKR